MSHSPCHHDCDFTDVSDDPSLDSGCCTSLPVRRDCGPPVLPVRDCDEAEPTVTFDEETETFTILSTLYDNNCSPLLDSNGSPLTALVA